MYELRIYKKAQIAIKKIPRLYQKAIIGALNEIQEVPLTGKPLTRELLGKFSFKVGPYRIIYKVSKLDKIIYVIAVGHRSKIYQ